MIDYFYPELNGPNKSQSKKFVNELLNPEQAYINAVQKANLKKPKNDLVERHTGKLLTNDGREMLNEKNK